MERGVMFGKKNLPDYMEDAPLPTEFLGDTDGIEVPLEETAKRAEKKAVKLMIVLPVIKVIVFAAGIADTLMSGESIDLLGENVNISAIFGNIIFSFMGIAFMGFACYIKCRFKPKGCNSAVAINPRKDGRGYEFTYKGNTYDVTVKPHKGDNGFCCVWINPNDPSRQSNNPESVERASMFLIGGIGLLVYIASL